MSIRICEVYARIEDLSLEKFVQIMNENNNVYGKYAIIILDKDVYTREDETRTPNHKAGKLKPVDIHAVCKKSLDDIQNRNGGMIL